MIKLFYSIFLVSIAGCQTSVVLPTAYDHCLVEADGWELVNIDSSIEDSLLSSEYEQSSVRTAFSVSGAAVRNAWFKNQLGDLMVCRYEDIDDSCMSASQTLIFKNLESKYETQKIDEKICMIHYRRT